MQHRQVIENFVTAGRGGLGTYVRADEDRVYSRVPNHNRWNPGVNETPLAVRLTDGSILANGAGLSRPEDDHQALLLNTLDTAKPRFGVVPFDSIVAAWTDGKERDWNQAPVPIKDLQKEVSVVVPSTGERWREVTVKDKNGRERTEQVHTLGDSVVRIRERFYISAVDETGSAYGGMYFLAELLTPRAPASFDEALDFLKPKIVREAEARGANVMRQGEWFAVPTKLLTSQLMRDVERGIAVYLREHVLGRDGHHKLEEAVIYRAGPKKGEVYARGVLTHIRDEHTDLDLGTIRWNLIVRNIQGASYTLSGRGGAQFD